MFLLRRASYIGCTCRCIAGCIVERSVLRRQLRSNAFAELGINRKLMRQLRNIGVFKPTDIQQKSIPSILRGDNVVINSETGSGKTLAYALPMLNSIAAIKKRRLKVPCPYGLIVVPGTELQYQVCNAFTHLLPETKVFPASEENLLRLLNTEVVVSTAAHLMTYEVESAFREVQTVVLDEADLLIATKIGQTGRKDPLFNLIAKLKKPETFRMFYGGYEEYDSSESEQKSTDHTSVQDPSSDLLVYEGDGSSGLKSTEKTVRPPLFKRKRQFVFVGATMPYSERESGKLPLNYIRRWFDDINLLKTDSTHKALTNVLTLFCDVEEHNKIRLLVQTLNKYETQGKFRVLVFMNRKETTKSVYEALNCQQFRNSDSVSGDEIDIPLLGKDDDGELQLFRSKWYEKMHVLHAGVHVDDRLEAFQNFSMMEESIMFTTDVAARGLDLPDVDIIVQYDFPSNVIDYIHRAGRTGRAGKEGKVVNFVTEKDRLLSARILDAVDKGESLENLFSRKRSLRGKLAARAYEDMGPGTDIEIYENIGIDAKDR